MLRKILWAFTFFVVGMIFRPFVPILNNVVESHAGLFFLNAVLMAVLGYGLGAIIEHRVTKSESKPSFLIQRRILSIFIGAVSLLALWVLNLADDMDLARFFTGAIVPLLIGGFIGGILELGIEQFRRSSKL